MQERSQLENSINNYSDLNNNLEEILELIDLYYESNEETDNFDDDILSSLIELSEKTQISTTEAMLSGEADSNSAFIEFHPGAGGTESQDWAQMLL